MAPRHASSPRGRAGGSEGGLLPIWRAQREVSLSSGAAGSRPPRAHLVSLCCLQTGFLDGGRGKVRRNQTADRCVVSVYLDVLCFFVFARESAAGGRFLPTLYHDKFRRVAGWKLTGEQKVFGRPAGRVRQQQLLWEKLHDHSVNQSAVVETLTHHTHTPAHTPTLVLSPSRRLHRLALGAE